MVIASFEVEGVEFVVVDDTAPKMWIELRRLQRLIRAEAERASMRTRILALVRDRKPPRRAPHAECTERPRIDSSDTAADLLELEKPTPPGKPKGAA